MTSILNLEGKKKRGATVATGVATVTDSELRRSSVSTLHAQQIKYSIIIIYASHDHSQVIA